jgi:hypothetical protein
MLLHMNGIYAAPIVNNSTLPVKYFIGREYELTKIKKIFFDKKQKTVALVGVGGIGKTQIIRKFIEENKDHYDVIWEIDCSYNIARQIKNLKEQLEDHFQAHTVSEDSQKNIEDTWRLLAARGLRYLIVFDSIQIFSNSVVANILPKEIQGNIIISAQVQGGLKNFIKVRMLNKKDSVSLVNKLDPNKDLDLLGVYQKTSGHPLSIVKYVKFSNANRYLNNREIDRWFFDDNVADYITKSLREITYNLSDSEFKALIKITLFNNKNISKINFILLCSQDNSVKDLFTLVQYGIIEEKQGYNDSIIGFEMHDILKYQLQKIASAKVVKDSVKEALETVNKLFYLKGKTLAQILKEQPNLLEQLEGLGANVKALKIPIEKQLELNSHLMSVYMYYNDHEGAGIQYKWFTDYIKSTNIKLIKDEKVLNTIAHFYLLLGIYDDFYYGDNGVACLNFYKARVILESLSDPDVNLEYTSRTQLAQSLLYGGDLRAAEREIKIIDELLDKKEKKGLTKRIKIFYHIEEDRERDATIFYFLRAKFFLEEGEYSLALDNANKALSTKSNSSNAHILAPAYSLKGEVLERMGDAEGGIKFAQEAYNKVSNKIKKDTELLARSLISLARCEKSLNKLSDARTHIKKAREILRTTNKSLEESRDDDLADAISIEGEILYLENQKKKSIELLELADRIYMNRFNGNIRWNKLEKLYTLIIRVAQDMKDNFLVKMYSKKLEAMQS